MQAGFIVAWGGWHTSPLEAGKAGSSALLLPPALPANAALKLTALVTQLLLIQKYNKCGTAPL